MQNAKLGNTSSVVYDATFPKGEGLSRPYLLLFTSSVGRGACSRRKPAFPLGEGGPLAVDEVPLMPLYYP